MIYKHHTICRACDSEDLVPILDLGEQPLVNAFVRDGTTSPHAPLTVLYCPSCTLIQLSVVVDSEILYHPGYAYVQQSRSATMQNHFKNLVDTIILEGGGGKLLEVGSNDGSFLEYLGHRGFKDRHGIDPSATGVEPATRELFNEETAASYVSDNGPVNLVIARHVFAHLDDWHQFVRAIDSVTTQNALVVLEVPDATAVRKNNDWPYFYHEHLSLVTRHSLNAVLHNTGWSIFDAKRFPIHGGSIAYFLRRGEGPPFHDAGFTAPEWHGFAGHVTLHIEKLTTFIRTLRDAGAKIAGYGAPARASVIAAACGFTKADISFITDWTPGKIRCLLPGTDIPVVHPDTLLEQQPDYALLFAYTYAKEILSRTSGYRELGGRFILPFPEPSITG